MQLWVKQATTFLGLDESQRAAFNHCLTTPLAIVQGPPGTGKTFIGVKLVEALLQIDPKAKAAPILVVTYKNHALDEFLKHLIVRSVVAKDRVVRIGGRSKEEILDGCNLKELCHQRKIYGRDFWEVQSEIEALQGLIRAQAEALDAASVVTADHLYYELAENQLLSLLDAKLGKNHRVVKMIPRYQMVHGSLVNFVHTGPSDQRELDFLNAVWKVIEAWLPDLSRVRSVRSLHAQVLQRDVAEASTEDKFDEEDIRQMQELRMGGRDGKDKPIELIRINEGSNNNEICFRISDFPGMFFFFITHFKEMLGPVKSNL